jgi:hypothetical protein
MAGRCNRAQPEFDAYWNSRNAVPVSRFDWRKPKPQELEEMLAAARQYRRDVADTPYIEALRDEQKRAGLLSAARPLLVKDVRLLVDDPVS